MVVDYSAVLTALINQLPALVISFSTLIGGYYAAKKITGNQTVAAEKLDSVHTLVNSVHGTSLRLAATLAERLARLTKDPVDIEAAEVTKKAADDHDEKQKQVDRKI